MVIFLKHMSLQFYTGYRSQYAVYNLNKSEVVMLLWSPQGSILDILLLKKYINDFTSPRYLKQYTCFFSVAVAIEKQFF